MVRRRKMSEKILARVRKINHILSESTSGYVSFDELCDLLAEMLDSNVYIINKRGKVLSSHYETGEEAPLVREDDGKVILPEPYNATLLLARPEHAYDDNDLAIIEYGATVVGLEVTKGITLEEEADSREKNAVNMALETLSYSELDAVTKIFAELNGDEGLLVASKIADKSGITRSVIVNALRKLESAGVIESRSLGMKGTRIKITNEFLRDEINKIDI